MDLIKKSGSFSRVRRRCPIPYPMTELAAVQMTALESNTDDGDAEAPWQAAGGVNTDDDEGGAVAVVRANHSVLANGCGPYLKSSLKEIFFGHMMNFLLLLTPFAFLSNYLKWGPVRTGPVLLRSKGVCVLWLVCKTFCCSTSSGAAMVCQYRSRHCESADFVIPLPAPRIFSPPRPSPASHRPALDLLRSFPLSAAAASRCDPSVSILVHTHTHTHRRPHSSSPSWRSARLRSVSAS